MSQGTEGFPDQPEEFLPLEGLELPEQSARFDPKQHRAFGSVPNLLGRELDVPKLFRIDMRAWQRTEPSVIKQGLYGVQGGNAVNGLVLSAEQYQAIIRNQDSFKSSIQARTQAANRQTNDVRAREKELLSVAGALSSKADRHDKVLKGLDDEASNLLKLQEWQKVPGYWRTTELEMRTMASMAWHDTFYRTLQTLKDQHDLTNGQFVDMTQALAYRLTRGSQEDRMRNWGRMLDFSVDYNRDIRLLFSHSARLIATEREQLEAKLETFYDQEGLLPNNK